MKIVIFCGGYGTRMWPASRKSYPKQFFPLLGGKSFFQNTVARFEKVFDAKDIIVSTEAQYVSFIHKQAPEIPQTNVIGEPERRDNLGAIGLVTALIEHKFPGEVMFFSWSDHLIDKEEMFLKAVTIAGAYTKETGRPVSIDQEPTYPTVHNGWLKMGKKVDDYHRHKLVEIEKHIEKPNIQTAKKLFHSGKYLIHTGYGAWRSDVLMNYYEKYAPEVYKGLLKILKAYGTNSYEKVLKAEYSKFEKVSVDYGLFEKIPARTRLTIPLEMGWRDAGTWELLYDSLARKEEETVVEGGADIELNDSSGNLIVGPKGKLISVIGLSNIAVIDTPDGLLICDLAKTQRVKEVFARLESDMPKYVD
jgi:mannose-1-phosphate guanylyltransferase